MSHGKWKSWREIRRSLRAEKKEGRGEIQRETVKRLGRNERRGGGRSEGGKERARVRKEEEEEGGGKEEAARG